MKKNYRIIVSLGLFLFVMVLPNVIANYFEAETRAVFHARLERADERCYERFKRDQIPTSICTEIEKSARLAFDEATHGGGAYRLLLTCLIGGLAFGLIELRRQVKELKEKTDV